ncbi:MAG: NTPase [Syntrophobacterales bacterium]|nr:NTPase [Syntrophobacterales bacterium]
MADRAGAGGPGRREAPPRPPRLLLTGPPQVGKTTVIRRVAELFPGRVGGFYTQEVREHGVRRGFEVVTLDGRRGWLARVDFPGPPRVGKYGVELAGFEAVALPAMQAWAGLDLVLIDEVGKMECFSRRFMAAMEELWTAPVALVATVALKGGGYIQELKARPEARILQVTPANRERLPAEIVALLWGEPLPG